MGLGVALQRGFRGVGCQVLRVEAEGSWAWRVLLIGSFDAVVGRFAVPLVDMGGSAFYEFLSAVPETTSRIFVAPGHLAEDFMLSGQVYSIVAVPSEKSELNEARIARLTCRLARSDKVSEDRSPDYSSRTHELSLLGTLAIFFEMVRSLQRALFISWPSTTCRWHSSALSASPFPSLMPRIHDRGKEQRSTNKQSLL